MSTRFPPREPGVSVCFATTDVEDEVRHPQRDAEPDRKHHRSRGIYGSAPFPRCENSIARRSPGRELGWTCLALETEQVIAVKDFASVSV